jgi:hypothetical protein
MGVTCSMDGRKLEMRTKFWPEDLSRRNHIEAKDVYETPVF